MRAGGQRGLHHRGPARVGADCRTRPGQPLDRRDHAFQLVALPHRGRAGAGAFTADIDDRRAGLEHGGGMGIGDLGIVHELAAVRKTVGRDVEDAHHLRLVEPDGPRAAVERGMRALEAIELRLHRAGQPGQSCAQFAQRIKRPRGNRAAVARDQRKAAGVNQPAGQPQRIAMLALRTVSQRDRAEVVILIHTLHLTT